jgi:hypothetical protein
MDWMEKGSIPFHCYKISSGTLFIKKLLFNIMIFYNTMFKAMM